MFDRSSGCLREVFGKAKLIADSNFCEYIGTEHLLVGLHLVESDFYKKFLHAMEINREDIVQLSERAITRCANSAPAGTSLPFGAFSKMVLEIGEAHSRDYEAFCVRDLLYGILSVRECSAFNTLTTSGSRHLRSLRESKLELESIIVMCA